MRPTQSVVLLCFVLLAALATARTIFAGNDLWTTTGPYGARIRGLVTKPGDPNIVLTGIEVTTNNLYRSTNSGQSWSLSNTGLPAGEVWAVAYGTVNTSAVYAALRNGGLYRSLDDGLTWASTEPNAPTLQTARRVAFSPVDANLIIVGTAYVPSMATIPQDAGYWRSADGGATWTRKGGDQADDVQALVSAPSDPNIFYGCGFNTGIYKSTDAGLTWQRTDTNTFITTPSCLALSVDPFSSNIVYLGTSHDGLWRSADGGASWAPISSNLSCSDIRTIVVDPKNQQILYVGCGGNPGTGSPGVFRSLDGLGTAWTELPEGIGSRAILSLAIDQANPQTIYAGTGGSGVWVRTLVNNVPDLSLSINDGALFTNQTAVSVTLTAPAQTTEVMLSNDGGFAGAAWQLLATHIPFTITAFGNYVIPRIVYAKFKTNGQTSPVYQDDIILDVTPPTGTFTVTAPTLTAAAGAVTGQNQARPSATTTLTPTIFLPMVFRDYMPGFRPVNLTLSATDDVSGVNAMLIANNAAFTGANWEAYKTQKLWLVPDTGIPTIYVRFRDRAGNLSSVSNVPAP